MSRLYIYINTVTGILYSTVYRMRCIVLYSSLLIVCLSDYTPYYPDYTADNLSNHRYKRVISVDNPLSKYNSELNNS